MNVGSKKILIKMSNESAFYIHRTFEWITEATHTQLKNPRADHGGALL